MQESIFELETQLSASLSGVGRGDDLEGVLAVFVLCSQSPQKQLEVSGELKAFVAQSGHVGHSEDLEASAQGRDIHHGRVRELKAGRPRRRSEMVRRCEAAILVTSPPAAQTIRETRSIFGGRDLAVSFMHEQPTYGPRAGIQILVAAPGGRIDIPIMEVQGHIAYCMSKVPDYKDAQRAGMGGDGADVEELASVELDPGEQ